MSPGGHEPRQRVGRSALVRWMLAAAVVAIALLVTLWVRLPRLEQQMADGIALKVGGGAQAVLPAVRDAEPAAPTVDAPAVPAPLAPDRATLVVELEGTGVIASAPAISVMRSGDVEPRTYGMLARSLSLDRAPGTYSLEMADDGWAVDEPSVTLKGGESRTVTVSSRRSAMVRVVGGLSGKPMPVSLADLDSQLRPETRAESLRVRLTVSPPAAVFAILGVPSWFTDGRLAHMVSVSVQTSPGHTAASQPLPLTDFEPSATVTIRVPELAIVGHVARAAAGDAGETPAENSPIARRIVLELLPAGHLPTMLGNFGPGQAIRDNAMDAEDNTDLAFADPDAAGNYQFLLAAPPPGPVHVIAGTDLDLLADSGPLIVSAASAPLRVDLVLPLGGSVRGTVRIGSGTNSAGDRVPMLQVEDVSARPIEAKGLSSVTRKRSGRVESNDTPDGNGVAPSYVISGLASGDYEIAAELRPQQGFAGTVAARTLLQRVTVRAGASTRADFDATAPSAGATVRGSVRLPENLDGAEVTVSLGTAGDRADDVYWSAATGIDAAGRYALTDVPPGAYELRAQTDDHEVNRVAAARSTLVVDSGDVAAPLLDLSHSELRLHATTGKRASLFVEGPRKGGFVWVQTDDAGNAQIYGLAPGHYAVRSASGPRTEFDLPAGATSLNIEVP